MYGAESTFHVPPTFRSEKMSSDSYSDGPKGPPPADWTIETVTVADSARSVAETRTTREGRGIPSNFPLHCVLAPSVRYDPAVSVSYLDYSSTVPLDHPGRAGLVQRLGFTPEEHNGQRHNHQRTDGAEQNDEDPVRFSRCLILSGSIVHAASMSHGTDIWPAVFGADLVTFCDANEQVPTNAEARTTAEPPAVVGP